MRAELSLLAEIVSLSCDPGVNVDEFHGRVASSHDLSAEVVRAGNSALYGMAGKIDRLERAVMILGPRTVASIAAAVVVRHTLGNASIGGLASEAIWLHSLETGVCARRLAGHLAPRLEHEAYLAGLLHHLGTLELFDAHAGACSAFPEVLQGALGGLQADGPSRSLAALVRAAHAAVRDPCAGWKDDTPGDEQLLADLGLLDGEQSELRREIRDRTKELAAVFG
ncbi:MAG: HDOD domain-containing protein [Myxococcota bacterium]